MKPRRKQTPLEVIARDANWRRGQIRALETRMRQVVADVAPNSLLPNVVQSFSVALHRHLTEWEIGARARATHYDPDILRNFERRFQSQA